jgi:mannosyltransferase
MDKPMEPWERCLKKWQRVIGNDGYLAPALGALLVLGGIFVPSSTLIESIRTVPEHLAEQLVKGATLFKIGMVIVGVLIMKLGRTALAKSETQAEPFPTEPAGKWELRGLLFILAVASALRLYGLNVGLWHDEIFTYVKFASMPVGEILTTYDSQNQNFLYSLLARVCFQILGEGAWSLRLPAVMFGVASIWAMYFFGRQIANAREALLTAALLTVSYHHIWFSQNARGYTGLLFWTLVASALFLQALRGGRRQLWLGYAATAGLGVYTQMTMLFVIVSHFIVYVMTLFARRKEAGQGRWAGLFLGFGITGFLILLLHALVLPQLLGTIVGQESTVAAWKNPTWTLLELLRGMRVGFVHVAIVIAALGIFGIGLVSFLRTNPVLLQFLFVPPLLCAAVNVAMGHHLWPRFFFFSFGFAALVIVRGTMILGQVIARYVRLAPANSVAFGTVLCAGLIVVSALSVRSAYAPKQDFKGALDFVNSTRQPGDAVVTVGLATFSYQALYKVNWKSVESIEALNAVRADAPRTWLLYTFPTHMAAVHPDIVATIQKDFEIVKRFPGTVGDGTIFVSRSAGPRL